MNATALTGRIAERWDMGQEIPKDSPNASGAFQLISRAG